MSYTPQYTITIKCSGCYPPLIVKKWKVFDINLKHKKNKFKNLEKELGFENHCITILKAAFEKKFSRFDGWIIKNNKYKNAYIQASKIYKRGVQYKLQNNLPSKPYIKKITYDINIFDVNDNEFKQILLQYKNCFFIIDKNVFNKWNFLNKFKNKIIIYCSENTKNFETVSKIIKHHKNNTQWVIIGGGVLIDIAAFAASLVNYSIIIVPTTLLAMIDVCVGGKTGINFYEYGKNQIGSFYFPDKVLIFKNWLNTLNKEQLSSGICEGIKHALLIKNFKLLKNMCKLSSDDLLALDTNILKKLILIKANIVKQDPFEGSCRAILNLGHTLGHALETYAQHVTNTNIPHGKAVGIGLIFSIVLSKALNIMDTKTFNHLIKTLQLSYAIPNQTEFLKKFPNYYKNFNVFCAHILNFIKHDKKAYSNKKINFILLKAQGNIYKQNNTYKTQVSLKLIKNTLKKLIFYIKKVFYN